MTAGAPSFELPNPQLSTDHAREIARAHWDLDGVADEIGSTQDQNFRITAADGRRFVLKIANPQWRRSELEMQNAAMLHVAAQQIEFAVPVPVAAPGGEEILRVGGHDVRLVTWVAGRPLSDFGHLGSETWHELGRLAARSARAMAGFEHPELDRALQWDPRRAPAVVDALGPLAEDAERALLDRAVGPLGTVGDLPLHPIHNDVTDYNTVAPAGGIAAVLPTGLLDFGDAVRTWRVCDPACSAVSAIVHDCADPLGVALAVLAGYHAESPLAEVEVEAFWPVVLARAAACAASATQQARLSPENTLAAQALVDDWAVLRAVDSVPPALAVAAARAVCGLEPSPAGSALPGAVAAADPVPVLDGPLAPVDLSVGSELLAFGEWSDPAALAALAARGGATAVGRWGESRPDPDGPAAAPAPTVRLGADLFAPPGTPVRAPLDGAVVRAAGGELEIACATGFVRFAGLASSVAAGDRVRRGETVGTVAAPALHVGLGVVPGLPAAGGARERAAWLALSPDPSTLLGIDVAADGHAGAGVQLARRERAVAAAQRLYYDEPPEFVRGWRHLLYDADGRAYVDAVNNVAVVGHSHPGVAAAAARQFRLLNTNSRFLYDAMTRYAERLSALLPDELDSVFLVNSGSEAVDLALRLARTFTGRHDVAALQGAYHGWTTATDELCTSPMDNPGWRERLPAHVHVVDQPDPFRGRFGDDGPAYVASLQAAIGAAERRGLAAFVCEPLLGNQGGVEPARGYLAAAYAAVRAVGAICIADEVQVGYARTGEDFWAFSHEGVVPDIVCVAKATGNGHPVGAVICRREIADAFDRAAPFFSSTGGGPVSCEIGLAVLDAIEQEELQANARRIGGRLRAGFERLAAEHPLIGGVHGRGLYLGIDLVRDPVTLEPAPEEAEWICERVRQLGVIVRPTGDAYNVLKIKPPLCIDEAGADHLLAALERALDDLRSR